MQSLDRFKCRWFDTKLKYMADVIWLNLQEDYALVSYSYADKYTPDEEIKISDGILMQCTGKRDINGKLIFEGDIVQLTIRGNMYGKHTAIKDVRYSIDTGRFCIVMQCQKQQDATETYPVEFSLFDNYDSYEIIGNIYEHNNLLEK